MSPFPGYTLVSPVFIPSSRSFTFLNIVRIFFFTSIVVCFDFLVPSTVGELVVAAEEVRVIYKNIIVPNIL